jgi:magnesium-protoporphyrin IX monomethyl ester (oxidative) cyclase
MGLSLLKAALADAGVEARVHYANLAFAAAVGVHPYDLVSRTNSHQLAGEWTFRAAAFPDAPAVPEDYFTHIAEGLRAFDHLVLRVGGGRTTRELVEHVAIHTADFVRATARAVLATRPAIVGCGSTFQQHLAALAVLREVKRLDPHVVTVLGGANCESEMGVVTHNQCQWVDYVVSGEAEEAFPWLCRAVLSGRRPDGHELHEHGVIGPPHRAPEKFAELLASPPRAIVSDMDSSPVPDFDDYFLALQTMPVGRRIEPGLEIETSRGCWWGAVKHCTFCGLNGTSMASRAKSPQRAVAEFHSLVARYRVPRVYAVDNILVREYFDSVLPQLRGDVEVFYETKANLKRDQVAGLARAGVRWIQPGLESLDDDILRMVGKGTTARQNIELLKWARELGVNVYWLLLYDVPGEQDAAYLRMAELLPLLAHLQPPRALSFVQFVRFSPYHRDPSAYQVSLSVEKSYEWVYPWPREVLPHFAYYFDDYTAGREQIEFHHDRPPRRPGFRAIRAAYAAWTAQWPHSGLDGQESMATLRMTDSGGVLTVTDTRACRRSATHTLRGLARAVSLVCHHAQTANRLRDRLRADFGMAPADDELSAVLAELADLKLLVRLGDYYLGLPLLGTPVPLPAWTSHPGGRIVSRRERQVWSNIAPLRDRAAEAAAALDADAAHVLGVLINCWLDDASVTRLLAEPAAVLGLPAPAFATRENGHIRLTVRRPSGTECHAWLPTRPADDPDAESEVLGPAPRT